MFAGFPFALVDFAGEWLYYAPTPPPPNPVIGTPSTIVCRTQTCGGENDFALYSLQDQSSYVPPAGTPTCRLQNCFENKQRIQADIEIYSLQDALIFNGTPITVIVTCPEGRTCAPGTFPVIITYPPETFILPDPPPSNGAPIVLTMEGCQSTVTRTLPSTATQAEINAAGQQIILAIAQQQAECDVIGQPPIYPPSPLFFNQAVTNTPECPDGESLDFSGTPPSYITFNGTLFTMQSGVVAGGSQAAANATAQSLLNSFVATATTNGTLTCVGCEITTASPLPAATIGVAYSEIFSATGVTPPLIWSVALGALPTGLSLNSSTGELSGTPTDSGSFNFSIKVEDAEIECEKPFSLFVSAGAECMVSGVALDFFDTNGLLTYEINSSGIFVDETGPGGDFSNIGFSRIYTGSSVELNVSIDITSNPSGAEFVFLAYIYQNGITFPSDTLLELGPFTTSQNQNFTVPAMPVGLYDTIGFVFSVRPGSGGTVVYNASITCV